MTSKAMVVMSGGLDSTTALFHTMSQGYECYAISFDYGQRHKVELEHASTICDRYDVLHEIVDLRSVGLIIGNANSSLVNNSIAVPEGHYGEESMKATVVPNRNMIMASIAVGAAIAEECAVVVMGVHAGDHFIYPDCRPGFFEALQIAVQEGNDDWPIIETPFINLTKNDIALRAVDLEVPIAETWSCYKGGELHCGKCGTCVERLEALDSVIATYSTFFDPTAYEDSEFWHEALDRPTVVSDPFAETARPTLKDRPGSASSY